MRIEREERGEPMTVQENQAPNQIQPTTDRDFIGPLVFFAVTVAVLVFFWWLLIYDHGVVSVH